MKGVQEMKIRKIAFYSAMIPLLTIFAIAGPAFAGAGPEPPPDGVVFTGPEVWGVVVMQCGPGAAGDDYIAIRVKRVVDCNVETQGLMELASSLGCPPNAAGAVGHTLPEGTTFWDIVGTPYITKVKNFKTDAAPNGDDIVSFDAQFKFWHR
jgi:hypothetical protein